MEFINKLFPELLPACSVGSWNTEPDGLTVGRLSETDNVVCDRLLRLSHCPGHPAGPRPEHEAVLHRDTHTTTQCTQDSRSTAHSTSWTTRAGNVQQIVKRAKLQFALLNKAIMLEKINALVGS